MAERRVPEGDFRRPVQSFWDLIHGMRCVVCGGRTVATDTFLAVGDGTDPVHHRCKRAESYTCPKCGNPNAFDQHDQHCPGRQSADA